jgi:large subunit ribosomal protein L13
MKTTVIQEKDVERKWYEVDAAGKPAGRLAVEVAAILRGKTKPTFAPHIDGGDFVVVTNIEKIKLSGNKEEQKIYEDYSGYADGLHRKTAKHVRATHPERILAQAVRGMLPKNHMGRKVIKRLKIYQGSEHPHEAQNPETVELV